MQAADNGFADVLTMTFPTARATGRLREDFGPSDPVLPHMANLGVVNACGDAAPDAWRRLATRRRPDDPVLRSPGLNPPSRRARARRPLQGHAPRPARRRHRRAETRTELLTCRALRQLREGDGPVTGSPVEAAGQHRHGEFDA